MADGRHFGKIEKSSYSVMAGSISTKFGMAKQFNPLEPSDCYKFEILKTQDGGGRHL